MYVEWKTTPITHINYETVKQPPDRHYAQLMTIVYFEYYVSVISKHFPKLQHFLLSS